MPPDVFWEKEGADDCGFLRLHQRHIGIDLILIIKQVLAEQALGESPFRLKQVCSLEIGVHPHYRREMVILDAVAGLRVVGDDFPAVSFMTRARAPPARSREKARAAWLISQFNSRFISPARWLVYIIPTPFSNTVRIWYRIKRFRGTERL